MKLPPIISYEYDYLRNYIATYLNDYPTMLSYMFGQEPEILRRMQYPYSKYGVTTTGIVVVWDYKTHPNYNLAVPATYVKETLGGPRIHVGLTTDHHTREVVPRDRLVLTTFDLNSLSKINHNHEIIHLDDCSWNDELFNLEWSAF